MIRVQTFNKHGAMVEVGRIATVRIEIQHNQSDPYLIQNAAVRAQAALQREVYGWLDEYIEPLAEDEAQTGDFGPWRILRDRLKQVKLDEMKDAYDLRWEMEIR